MIHTIESAQALDLDTQISGLAHELWAMAQGRAPIEDVVPTMMATLRSFAAAVCVHRDIELLDRLSDLVDRCAYDGVPNDSLPVWQAAHDAVMRRGRLPSIQTMTHPTREEVDRMKTWIEGDCACPCCGEVRECLPGCTFAADCPADAERMAGAREVLYGAYAAGEVRADAERGQIAAAERERCAKLCEEVEAQAWALWKATADPMEQGRNIGAQHCADAIRATT